MAGRYNHALSLGFEVLSDDPDGSDITPQKILEAVHRRLSECAQIGELEKACLPPWDTFDTRDH